MESIELRPTRLAGLLDKNGSRRESPSCGWQEARRPAAFLPGCHLAACMLGYVAIRPPLWEEPSWGGIKM